MIDLNDDMDEIFTAELGIIGALDAGYTFFSKDRRPFTDTFKIGDQVVVNIDRHKYHLYIAKVIDLRNERIFIQVSRDKTIIALNADHLLHLRNAKRKFRDKIISKQTRIL